MEHMEIIYTLLQTDNYASTSSLSFLQAGRSTNSVKALTSKTVNKHLILYKHT